LSIGASANATGTVFFGPPERLGFGTPSVNSANSLIASTGLNYSETPTITYVPVEGQQFANQILTGASVNSLQALLQSGWDIDRVMLLLVDRMGPLVNNPAAATYPQFVQLVKIWRQVQVRGDLFFVWYPQADVVLAEKLPASAINTRVFNVSSLPQYLRYNPRPDGNHQLVQTFDSVVMELHYANQEEAAQVSALLGSVSARPPGELVERVALVSAVIPPNDYTGRDPVTQLLMNLRSFADMLFAVTPGVAVPPEDAAVVYPVDPGTAKFIHVRANESHPSRPFVAVQHRGHWFTIADTDIESKVNFGLLLTVMSLQTTSAGAVPGLTIPVGH
jgi:hypothetical protein